MLLYSGRFTRWQALHGIVSVYEIDGHKLSQFIYESKSERISLLKSVHICQSYRKNKSGTFLWPTVYFARSWPFTIPNPAKGSREDWARSLSRCILIHSRVS